MATLDRKILYTRQQIEEIVEDLDRIKEIPNRKLGKTEHMFVSIHQMLVEVKEMVERVDHEIAVASTMEELNIPYAFRRKSSKGKKAKKSMRKGKKSKKSKRSVRK